MSTILVVEDDPIIRQTVEYTLRRAGFEVHTAPDGGAAINVAASYPPDLVLLDLMLPGDLDGYDVAAQLRSIDRDIAIIMVSALDAERDKVRGLDAGADDYITKPFSMEELLARVRANLRRVRAREAIAENTPLDSGDLRVVPGEFRATVAGEPVRLRVKEFQLLVTLMRREGSLCTRQLIAEEVWGYEHLPSSRTIDVHIRRLRQAIEELSSYEYIHTVHGLGYRFEAVPKSSRAQGADS